LLRKSDRLDDREHYPTAPYGGGVSEVAESATK
jgi:hypothetical protein